MGLLGQMHSNPTTNEIVFWPNQGSRGEISKVFFTGSYSQRRQVYQYISDRINPVCLFKFYHTSLSFNTNIYFFLNKSFTAIKMQYKGMRLCAISLKAVGFSMKAPPLHYQPPNGEMWLIGNLAPMTLSEAHQRTRLPKLNYQNWFSYTSFEGEY